MSLFLLILIWEYLQSIFRKIYISNKINKNLVSFVHCIGCIIFSYNNILEYNSNNYLYYWSMSYFTWDIIKLIFNRDFADGLYIYHHILCLWALNELYLKKSVEVINYLFFYGEISNIFNFIYIIV